MAECDDNPEGKLQANADLIACLRESRAFAGFDADALAAVAALGEVLRFDVGHVLITEGTDSSYFYILMRGQVSIQVESISPALEIGIARLGVGEIIGEGGLLSKSSRSTSAVFMQEGIVASFHPMPFLQLMESERRWGLLFFRNLATVLAARLRLTDRRILNLTRAQFFHS